MQDVEDADHVEQEESREGQLRYLRDLLGDIYYGLRDLLAGGAHLIIRLGGRKLDPLTARYELARSLRDGLGAPVELIEHGASRVRGNQVRAFRPGAAGCQVEYDFHFRLR